METCKLTSERLRKYPYPCDANRVELDSPAQQESLG
jgi:hypothetical protein